MYVRKTAAALAAMALAGGVGCGRGEDGRIAALEKRIAQLEAGAPAGAGGPQGPAAPTTPKPATEDKATTYRSDWAGVPLDDVSKRGVDWLVSVQGDDGGWGQDGGHKGDAR